VPELAAVIIALIFVITVLIFTGTVLILLYAFAQIWMSNSNDKLKKKLVLALLSILGAFLSISAIASVPWLQQEVTIPSTLSESRLEKQRFTSD
jgi:O-antigen ligase